jgi:hypothetical protein
MNRAAKASFRRCLLTLLLALTGLAGNCPAYEPPADPAVRIWQGRATRVQLIKLRSLAAARKLDLAALVQSCYFIERAEDLSNAQAAELIVRLQQRGPDDFSRPHTLRNWIGAQQERNINTFTLPLVILFGL